jgi:2-polyprenyl-3-methyl-5-hydroxy-6-metoxy-1,4-benzoquinol methylase
MYQEHVARYAFAARFAPGAHALDVGCGVGYGSRWLADAGAASVRAIDIAEDAINHARGHYFHEAVSFEVQSATDFSFPDQYDLVTCFELIEHVRDQEGVLDNIAAAMKPSGRLVISTPRPLDDIRTHYHEKELHFEELFALLRARFKNVRALFQVNCFTSYVGTGKPDSINEIVNIADPFSLEKADYFIFVASNVDEEFDDRPLLSLNDDSYILTLENDVSVLRGAEAYHKGLMTELEQSIEQLQQDKNDALQQEAERQIAEMRQALSDAEHRLKLAEEARSNAEVARLDAERRSATRDAMLTEERSKVAELIAQLEARDVEAGVMRREILSSRDRIAVDSSKLDAVELERAAIELHALVLGMRLHDARVLIKGRDYRESLAGQSSAAFDS